MKTEYDVIVVGSGAGGLTAALAAADRGLSTLIIEKADVYGGSTALSGGGVWIPNSPQLERIGIVDSRASVRGYLDSIVGDHVPSANLDAFIDEGPKMMAFLDRSPHLKFQWCTGYSDYHPENPGGRPEGRSVEPMPFDIRALGEDADLLRSAALATPPGLYITQKDFVQLNMVTRTWKARRQALKTGVAAVIAVARKTRMETLGRALAARLRLAVKDAHIPLWLSTPMESLVTDETGAVTGVEVTRDGDRLTLTARRGVILATGGFEHNQEMRDAYLPDGAGPNYSAASKDNTGDGIRAGQAVGAAVDLMDDAWWMPSMQLPNGVMQVLVAERSIPRSLIVDTTGRRFTNEASPYVTFTHAQLEGGHVDAWFIFDSRAKNRYPVGGIMPGQKFPKSWLADGLIHTADTVTELAQSIGVDPEGLGAEVARVNELADRGHDDDFSRGDSAYDRYYGDPSLPHPVLDSVDRAPYYAMRMRVGDLGTKGGLVYNENAQVRRTDGSIIDGLYAVGNTSAAVMGNEYAGPGATIGPAMTFGWIAANHAADKTADQRTEQTAASE
ncbi:FAD-dependent oxidoreductase [Gordonia malaquae]|uniref:FAD-dependent oxidoreductase n=1 Tax=Gordonia malaquae TaxID=410332 RepID=UPI0030C78ECE